MPGAAFGGRCRALALSGQVDARHDCARASRDRTRWPRRPCLGLRDLKTGRIASAKRFPRLLAFRATYPTEPTPDSPGRVLIEAPDGRTFHPDEPGASELISDILEHPLHFESEAGDDEKTSIDRETVFAGVPVSAMKPDWTPKTMPDYFELKTGSFLEIGAVFVLASGFVDHLRTLQGGTALIDRRRFRPNFCIDTGDGPERFVEDEWLGRALAMETARCSTSSNPRCGVSRPLGSGGATARSQRPAYGRPTPLGMPRRLCVGPRAGAGAGGPRRPRGLAATGRRRVTALCWWRGPRPPSGPRSPSASQRCHSRLLAPRRVQRIVSRGRRALPSRRTPAPPLTGLPSWLGLSRAAPAPRWRRYVAHDVGGLG